MMPETRKYTLSIPLAIALLMLCVGHIALINDREYGLRIYVFALVSIGILNGMRSSLMLRKGKKETFKLFSVLAFVTVEISGVVGFDYTYIFAYTSILIGLIWITLEIIEKVNGENSSAQPNPVLWIGIILMITYVIIGTMYLPFGNIIFLFGLIISSLGFIVEYILLRNKKQI